MSEMEYRYIEVERKWDLELEITFLYLLLAFTSLQTLAKFITLVSLSSFIKSLFADIFCFSCVKII